MGAGGGGGSVESGRTEYFDKGRSFQSCPSTGVERMVADLSARGSTKAVTSPLEVSEAEAGQASAGEDLLTFVICTIIIVGSNPPIR